jgi:hypothetical protein
VKPELHLASPPAQNMEIEVVRLPGLKRAVLLAAVSRDE